MSDAANEDLVHVKMTAGDDPLSWSVLKVTIVVEGGTSLTCVEDSKDDGTAPCTYMKDATDNFWDVAEEITISEGDSNDLCDGTDGGCDMVVTLTKESVGNDEGGVLRNVDARADGNLEIKK